MADFDFDDYGAPPRFSMAQTQRFLNITGAICSIGLLAGVVVWGYNLAVRDVSGVPVIRAAEGPLRVAPANPGGTIADHQGMAVNAIPELGLAEPLPEEIILAPEPVQLEMDDAPGLAADLPPLVVDAAADGAEQVPLGSDPLIVTAATIAPAPETVAANDGVAIEGRDAVAAALAEALGLEDSTLTGIEPTAALPVPGNGLAKSPRPMPRPAAKRVSVDAGSITPVAARVVDASSLVAGERLVQLGAFDTQEEAKAEWASLGARFGDLMSGKGVVVQEAESGGRTFYRLRAEGFEGEDDARRFCTALLAEDATCVPVVHR